MTKPPDPLANPVRRAPLLGGGESDRVLWWCSARAARLSVFFFAASLLLGTAAPARGAEGDSVEQLYREGRRARERGELDRALELLQRAWSLRKTHDVAASLAQVEYEIGNVRDAAEHLAYACEHLPAGADPERVARLVEALEQIKREVVTLKLVVEPNTALIALNARQLGLALSLPEDIFADPGSITVTAELDGYARWATTLRGRAGEVKHLRVRLEAVGAAQRSVDSRADAVASDAPSSVADSTERSSVPMIVSASVAGAALVTGVAFWLSADSRASDAERRLGSLSGQNRCGPGTPYVQSCREVRQDLDAEKTFRGIAYASFAAAATGAALTYLLWPRQERSVSVGASLETSAVWAVAQGRF